MQELAELIQMPFMHLSRLGPRNDVLNGGSDPLREGALLKGDMSAHCNVPVHECSVPVVGECACLAHAVDKYICRRKDKTRWRCSLLPKYFVH